MNNGNGKSYTHINSFREGLTNATNGHGSGQINELLHNITSLRRGILDMASDKRRNLDHDFGWPSTGALNPETYRDLYDRDSIANRVVNLMPKECWQVTPEIYEREKGEVATPFEKSWRALNESVAGSSWHGGEIGTAVFAKLKLLDIMSGIGSFGIMLIGLDDGKRLDEPAEGVVEKVVSGMAFNAQNRIVDSWMTEEEEKKLKAWDGKEKRPKPLSNDEVIAVNAWARQRDMLHHAVAKVEEETRNQRVANLRPDDGANNPRSPKNMFSSYDTSQTQAQQWFGTQFGEPEKLAEKPGTTERKVTFLRVFDESAIQVTRWEASVLSPRFGQPVIYRVTFNDPRDQSGGSLGMPSTTAFVHWSRVIHVPSDERGSNDAIGNSRLKAVINDVLDIRKVRGSSPEGYYQSCFPILAFETHPQLGDDVDVDMADLRSQVENLVNSLQRSLLGKGGSWKTLPPSVVDPTPHIEAGITAICIQKSCPVRIFKGSERGELASSQDDSQWNDRIRERQNGHVTPVIIVPFIDRLILMGVLQAPEKPGENPRVPGDELPPNDQAMGNDVPEPEPDAEDRQPVAKKPLPKPIANRRWVWNARTNRIETTNAAPPFPPKAKAKPPIPVEGEDDPATTDDDPMAEGQLDDATQLEDGNPNEVTVDIEPGYKIDWPDLDSLGDMDRATIANTLTQALSAYVQSGAADFMPPFEYFTQVWQMDDNEAAMVVTAMEKHQEEVKLEQEEQQAMLAEEQGFAPEAPEGFVDPEQRDMDHEVALAAAENPAGAAKPPGGGFPPKGGGGKPSLPPKKGKPPVGNAATLEDVENVFCATGEGGGVDPTCSPGGTSIETYAKSLSDEDKQVIQDYQSTGVYDPLNNYLRTGKLAPTGELPDENLFQGGFDTEEAQGYVDSVIADMDRLIDGSVTTEPLTVYRGVGNGVLPSRLVAGNVVIDKGFASTSADSEEASGFAGKTGTVLKISLPTGAKALATDSILDLGQKEFILPRGTMFGISKVEKVGRQRVLHVSVVPKQKTVENVFCPTGDEGGVDPSCSPGGSAAATSGGAKDAGQHGDFGETKSGPPAIHAKAKDADAFARENIENATLTPEQSEAVESYRTTRDSYDINNHLRGTGPITQTWKTKMFGLSAKQQAAMDNLDKVIAGSRTKTDMVVMRGFGIDKGSGFGAPQTVDSLFKPGSTFTDNGFMSTTLASEVAERFSTKGGYVDDDRVIMHIEVPKGSNGYYMPRKPGAYDEAEMVMPRGSRFTVSKVEKIDKHMYKVHVKHIGVKSNGSTK